VYLDESWRGSDQDLAQLADLHALSTVCLVRAPITNKGLAHLADVPNLMSLTLAETKVTDDGLAVLRPLKQLMRIHLEGTVNGLEFTDKALQHLPKTRMFYQPIVLYGRGFTDAITTRLDGLGPIFELHLVDTALSKPAVEALKKRGGDFMKVHVTPE